MNKLLKPEELKKMRGNTGSTKSVSGSLSSVKDLNDALKMIKPKANTKY